MYPDHGSTVSGPRNIFCQFPPRRHLWAAGAAGGTFLAQLCIFSITRSWAFAEENALSSNLLVRPSHNFLTSPFRRQKRRRECVEAGKLSSICRNYQPENRLHNNPWHNRLLLTPPAKWRDGQHGRGQFGQWVVLVEFGIVWLDSAKFGKDWSLRWR